MIEQEALVESVQGDMAMVRVARQSACGSCDAKSGCGTSLLASLFPDRSLRFTVDNRDHARVGDRVLLGLPESGLQLASLLLYGLPLGGLLLGAMAGQSLAAPAGESGELSAIVGGVLGLAAGLLLARYFGSAGRSGRLRPVMLRRLPTAAVEVAAIFDSKPTSSSET